MRARNESANTVPVLARVIVRAAGTVPGIGQVLLAAELERAQLDVLLVAELLAGAQPDLAQAERSHGLSLATACGQSEGRPTRTRLFTGRAETIRATATMMAAPPMIVVSVIGSPSQSVPSRTATTGLTYA